MSQYQNPVPDPDDEPQSRTVMIPFRFEKPVTAREAAESLNIWFAHNALLPENVRLTGRVGICYKQIQPSLGRNDRDPRGYGPRD